MTWRQITAALMLLAFTSSVISRIVIVMDYYANTAAYAQNCINKTRPALHCNGKCQMMQRLQQEEQDNRDTHEKNLTHKAEWIVVDAGLLENHCLFSYTTTVWPCASALNPIDKSYRFFRPPVVV